MPLLLMNVPQELLAELLVADGVLFERRVFCGTSIGEIKECSETSSLKRTPSLTTREKNAAHNSLGQKRFLFLATLMLYRTLLLALEALRRLLS